MLDIGTYNLAEQLAKTSQSHHSQSSAHNLEAFQITGFPTNIKNFGEMYQLIDAFHEGQLDRILVELGGLSEEEIELLVTAVLDCVRLQMHLYPGRNPIIPYHAIMGGNTPIIRGLCE